MNIGWSISLPRFPKTLLGQKAAHSVARDALEPNNMIIVS